MYKKNDSKQPIRMCCACRKHLFKFNLFRFVKDNDMILLDSTYKKQGRGVYVCKDEKCINKLKKTRILEKLLELKVKDDFYEKVENEYKLQK